MNSKTLLLIINLICIQQVYPENVIDGTLQNIWDDCESLLNDLFVTIEEAMSSALPVVEPIPSEIITLGQTTVTLVTSEIERRVDDYSKQLEELTKQASELGKPECVTGKQKELDRVTVIVVGAIENCVSINIETSLNLVEESLLKLTSSLNVVNNYRDEIKACESSNDENCALRVKQEIETDINESPIRIQNIVDAALAERNSLKTATQTCGTDRISLAITLGTSILNSVRQCLI